MENNNEQKNQSNTPSKNYEITDIDKRKTKDREMAVFTNSKNLSEYIFKITQNSPIKFRWSIIARLQNTSVELIENLYRANFEKDDARTKFQKNAKINLCLIDFYTETAKQMQAISTKQMLYIGKQLEEIKKLLEGWIKSTNKQK